MIKTRKTLETWAVFSYMRKRMKTSFRTGQQSSVGILSIVRNSPNGRVLFNELQKAFGNKNASEYMRVLREWKNAQ